MDTPVQNFGVVEQGILYRSAQPHELALPWLRRYGIASIVNLREERYDDGDWLIARLGFTSYLRLPIDNHTPPTEAQAVAFLTFVQDQRNWPVLVHCAEGKGRTGVLVALTRYAIDGWSVEQALAETNNYTNQGALSDSQRAWLAQWARTHAPGDQRATLQPAAKQEE
jgi:protein tyrosine/serine phosphatase